MSTLRNISNATLPATVPVLINAVEELVTRRELRGQHVKKRKEGYCTNRSIKTWSCFFLLKALTTSGKIQNWTGTTNKKNLLSYTQMNENTFRRRLKEMAELELCFVNHCSNGSIDIILTNYKEAADILGIYYEGTYNIDYNPKLYEGKQIFQYFLRAEEFRIRQQKQLDAFTYHLDNNLSLRNTLHYLLRRQGADDQRLTHDPEYFRERLLQLQMHLFREGSDILVEVTHRRADINRSVKRIKKDHNYKGQQSVTYLKRKMIAYKLIDIKKVCIESKVRSRLYVPDDDSSGGSRRDAYKWLSKKKQTAWFLTDQVTVKFKSHAPQRQETTRKAA